MRSDERAHDGRGGLLEPETICIDLRIRCLQQRQKGLPMRARGAAANCFIDVAR